ncbi:MAG: class I SAM-dependent methyltransferase [Anaerolineales bacterium]|nr:class I SAM-dependent methyltransferase [Anaerolineales bacterium]
MSIPTLILKPSREKSLLRRHPWVFSGAVQNVNGEPQLGATVEVRAADGRWLAHAAYSPQSQITARVWSFAENQEIAPEFFRQQIQSSISRRTQFFNSPILSSSATRLVNAESDGLPGLVVDRYADYLVCQFLSAGAEFWRDTVVHVLQELVPCAGIYERSDVDVRGKEGLPTRTGVLAGAAPPELIEIEENGARLLVDVLHGHKTGFYLDQWDNRARLAGFTAGKDVLNCFAYTGGFGVMALKGGAAHVTQIDSSGPALELARRNCELNTFSASQFTNTEADVFHALRQFRDSRRQFDVIVLDPPKFAESKHQVERAARGYKDINLLAFKLLRPGGVLFTFSCSGAIEPPLFQKIVADAALDAGREAQILHRLTQAADHPVALNFPEGEYLKGLVCGV